jgi:hypothetical protein
VTAAKLPKLETLVLAVALVVLILDASGGPGWGAASASAVLAVRLDHLASAPLYDLVAGATATLLPFGEVGFRLALLDAILAACTLAGVVAAVRALLPRDLATAPLAVLLLLIAPPFRDAAAFAGPAMLATCGAVWAVACATSFARDQQDRAAASALAACALVVGSAPWLGAAFTLAIGAWLAKAGARNVLALGIGALGLLSVVWWLGATGGLPGAGGSLALAVAASGRGAAAVIVGAGLLGVGFAALTGLPNARWLALLVVIAGAHEIVVGGTAPVMLALLAIGAAIVPSAIVRATQPDLEGTRRHALGFGAGVPLLAIAIVLGATFTVEDPRAAPTELATDLTSRVPHGPGVFVATRAATWFALQYEAGVAGGRPDLTLVPPLPAEQADAIVANALRGDRIAAADAAAFGRLDLRRVIPRGRGFQLVGEIPSQPAPVSGPARYASRIGHEQAVLLAIERARHEAASQRLDAAARALGLEARFGAADLAVLAVTLTTAERPALFGFLPLDDRPGTWMLDLFADDLAWVAGLAVPPVDDRAPLPRRLHAKWRDILLGKAKPDDPAIAAMGQRAVRATQQLFAPK